jgi:hypothetical protein
MRYCLRTLLIVLAVGPPLLAAAIILCAFFVGPWEEGGEPPANPRFTLKIGETIISISDEK